MLQALPLPSTHVVFLLDLAPAQETICAPFYRYHKHPTQEAQSAQHASRTRDTHLWAIGMSADDKGEDMSQHPAITHRQIRKLIVLVKCNIGRSCDWSIQGLYIDITPNNVSKDPEVM
jgi:hypothetical protein